MVCFKCSVENSEQRTFCRECGALLVMFCKRCGFHNSLMDKFCGGCGANLSSTGALFADPGAGNASQPARPANAYSVEDINEFIRPRSDKSDTKKKKSESEETEAVSQDVLDDIFNSGKRPDHE